jgi:drug/metabolite transporter (DMT)-like permease
VDGRVRSPRAGYVMALGAAALFAVNGAVSKVALTSGLEAPRLTALRCLGAFLGLAAVLAVAAPRRLRLTLAEVPFLIAFGVIGVAMTQWLYFVAIGRLPVGIALLLEFTAPVLVALWAWLALGEHVRARLWAALALALSGLALVARIWTGGAGLDAVGVAAALGAALTLASYYILGERGVTTRDPVSLTCWSVFFGAVFWSVVQPWWHFDAARLAGPVDLLGALAGTTAPMWALVSWIVVLGTIVPFSLSVGALTHLPATTVGIAAMAEPVLASLLAWLWLEETLSPAQLVGGGVVLLGIGLAQTARRVPAHRQGHPAPAPELVG